VLDAISPGRAATIHRRILAALLKSSDGGDAAELAYHAEEAGDAEGVLVYARAAAVEAERLSAHREAAAQYARALRFSDSLPPGERAALHEACAREAFLSADVGLAVDAARATLDLRRELGEPVAAGGALAQLAGLLWHTKEAADAKPLAREAIALLEQQPPGAELASAYSTLASLHAKAAEMREAASVAGRALELANHLDLVHVRIQALGTIGAAKLCGPNEDGWPELERALETALAADLPAQAAGAYGRLVWFAAMHRQFDYFDRIFEDALAFCEQHDLAGTRLGLLQSRTVELLHRGRWTEAGELAQSLLVAPGIALVDRIQPLYVLGRLRARRGDSQAWAALDEALELAAPRNELAHVGNVRAARAEAAWLEGDRARTADEAAAAYPIALPVGDPWILGELALWLWRADSLDALPTVVVSHPYGLQIRGDWAAAAAAWQRLDCPFEAAAALLDSDEESALRRSLQIFDGLGARPAVAMAARKLRSLGVRRVPRGPQRSTLANPHNLTRRQYEVLVLLGEGLTDAEIGERLFLSTKTVNHHVSAILAKLGVGSRAQAAARLN
jgi:DNA-binding CsgD family transcriptional regulator